MIKSLFIAVSLLAASPSVNLQKLPVAQKVVSVPDQLKPELEALVQRINASGVKCSLEHIYFSAKKNGEVAIAVFKYDGKELAAIFIYADGKWQMVPDQFE